MAKVKKVWKNKKGDNKGGDLGAVYCLGLIGAAVYYVQKADGFGEVLVALLKGILWPAYLLFELLGYINA